MFRGLQNVVARLVESSVDTDSATSESAPISNQLTSSGNSLLRKPQRTISRSLSFIETLEQPSLAFVFDAIGLSLLEEFIVEVEKLFEIGLKHGKKRTLFDITKLSENTRIPLSSQIIEVSNLSNATTEKGKARAMIVILLFERILASIVQVIAKDTLLVKETYEEYAPFSDPETVSIFVGLLQSLSVIDFDSETRGFKYLHSHPFDPPTIDSLPILENFEDNRGKNNPFRLSIKTEKTEEGSLRQLRLHYNQQSTELQEVRNALASLQRESSHAKDEYEHLQTLFGERDNEISFLKSQLEISEQQVNELMGKGEAKKRDKKMQELKDSLTASSVLMKQKDKENQALRETIESYMKQFSDLTQRHTDDLLASEQTQQSLRSLLESRDDQVRVERETIRMEREFERRKFVELELDFNNYKEKTEKETAELNETISKLESQLGELQSVNLSLSEDLSESRKSDLAEKENSFSLSKELEETKLSVHKLSNENEELKNEIKNISTEKEQTDNELSKSQIDCAQKSEEISELKMRIESLESNLSELRESLNKTETDLQDEQTQKAKLQSNVEDLSERLSRSESLHNRVVQALGEQARAQTEALEKAQQSCSALITDLDRAENACAVHKGKAEEAEREIFVLKAKIFSAENDISAYTLKLKEFEKELKENEDLLNTFRRETSEIESNNVCLRGQVSDLSERSETLTREAEIHLRTAEEKSALVETLTLTLEDMNKRYAQDVLELQEQIQILKRKKR